ncbi:helix-turn-helix domain-containing protein [Chitinophaga sp. Hz27]|uniref:helix-turn-helix domain-containing protein n=1 Tax=Chitinophaga sp. Hz27 TaxID=3347169 RepID=UPI0035D987A7
MSLPEYNHTNPSFIVSGLCELGDSFFEQIGKAHRHDFYTIYWIKKGKLRHSIDSVSHEVKDNTLFFLAPGQVHNIQSSEKIEGYMIAFQDSFMCLRDQSQTSAIKSSLFFNSQFSSVIQLSESDTEDFDSVIKLMMKELSLQEPDFDTALHGLLRYFLVLASRVKGESVIATNEQHAAHNSSIFLKFKNLIEEKYTELKNVSDYANLLYIKPVLLNEISKQLSGITAGEHIRNRVILEAQRYLHFTDLTAKEIAYKLGFEDPHYFSRFFKKYTNQSPSEFKEAAKAVNTQS